MARITLEGINKRFADSVVLEDINLEIGDGEFLTLVGPSGCGKSTTLRIIAGLENPSSGEVAIDGQVVNAIRPSRRDLAMVFQSYALYPHLTVRQNLETPLVLRDLNPWQRLPLFGALMPSRRAKKVAIDRFVLETAQTLKIEDLLERKPGQLSGGQRQRVALGRAMVRKPHAFLMDEPLSNLDAGLRVHMRAELSELHRKLATTFVYVTHDQAEALTMSDRMAVMMDGRILQVGAPFHVYREPDDIRVARFIGSPQINILPGDGGKEGHLSCLGVRLSPRCQQPAAGALSIGIRPEHTTVRSGPGDDSFSGRLTYKENLGSDVYLHLALRDGAHRLVARTTPTHAMDVSIGNHVCIGYEPDKLLVFDAGGSRVALRAAQDSEQTA